MARDCAAVIFEEKPFQEMRRSELEDLKDRGVVSQETYELLLPSTIEDLDPTASVS